MPLEAETSETVASFVQRKRKQWETLAAPHGVQMVRSGEGGTQIAIGLNLGDVHESVVIGQWPMVVMKNVGSPRNPVRRLALEHEKPIERRRIDMTDEEINGVVSRWSAGQSAAGMPGVVLIYRNGKLA